MTKPPLEGSGTGASASASNSQQQEADGVNAAVLARPSDVTLPGAQSFVSSTIQPLPGLIRSFQDSNALPARKASRGSAFLGRFLPASSFQATYRRRAKRVNLSSPGNSFRGSSFQVSRCRVRRTGTRADSNRSFPGSSSRTTARERDTTNGTSRIPARAQRTTGSDPHRSTASRQSSRSRCGWRRGTSWRHGQRGTRRHQSLADHAASSPDQRRSAAE